MPGPELSDTEIKDLLLSAKIIAMVGASDNPDRPSYGVMRFLLDRGKTVLPVNPGLAGKFVQSQPVYARLSDITVPVDIVDVFRASEHVGPIVDEAIAIGAKAVWMQLGVINEEAAAKARAAGLKVVMNRCPKIEWGRLRLS